MYTTPPHEPLSSLYHDRYIHANFLLAITARCDAFVLDTYMTKNKIQDFVDPFRIGYLSGRLPGVSLDPFCYVQRGAMYVITGRLCGMLSKSYFERARGYIENIVLLRSDAMEILKSANLFEEVARSTSLEAFEILKTYVDDVHETNSFRVALLGHGSTEMLLHYFQEHQADGAVTFRDVLNILERCWSHPRIKELIPLVWSTDGFHANSHNTYGQKFLGILANLWKAERFDVLDCMAMHGMHLFYGVGWPFLGIEPLVYMLRQGAPLMPVIQSGNEGPRH